MNVIEYDKMTDYHNVSLSIKNNCTNDENIIDIIIPTLWLTIPSGLPF